MRRPQTPTTITHGAVATTVVITRGLVALKKRREEGKLDPDRVEVFAPPQTKIDREKVRLVEQQHAALARVNLRYVRLKVGAPKQQRVSRVDNLRTNERRQTVSTMQQERLNIYGVCLLLSEVLRARRECACAGDANVAAVQERGCVFLGLGRR